MAARIGEQLEQVLGIVRDGIGPDVVGAYLHCSAVLDGLRPHTGGTTWPPRVRPLVDHLVSEIAADAS